MLNIALCCSAAMSTSLLVNKMIDEANKQGIQIHIWAKGVNGNSLLLLEFHWLLEIFSNSFIIW